MSASTWTDRVFLITGAKRIGVAIAAEAAARGADVALTCFQSRSEAEQTARAVRDRQRRAIVIPSDLREPSACRHAVQETVRQLGRIDALIGMASVYRELPFDQLTDEQWSENLAVDLSSAFHCARAAACHMQATHFGRMLFIADSDAASGRPKRPGYLPHFVAKSALIALGKALALELAPSGILVNVLALGPILLPDCGTAEQQAETARQIPVLRWGTVEDAARAAFSIIESEYMTGEVSRTDGGRHLV